MTDTHDHDDRPWEELGAVRRDCEPHRAELLLGLGTVSVVLGFTSFAWLLPALPGLLLGLVVLVIARRDVRMMRAGLMDPEGERQTRRATHAALVGVALSLVGGMFLCWEVWRFWLIQTSGHGYVPLIQGLPGSYKAHHEARPSRHKCLPVFRIGRWKGGSRSTPPRHRHRG